MSSNQNEISDKAGMVKEGTKDCDFSTQAILKTAGASSAPLDFQGKKSMPSYKVVGQKVPILDENKMIMKGDMGPTQHGKNPILPKDMDKNLKD